MLGVIGGLLDLAVGFTLAQSGFAPSAMGTGMMTGAGILMSDFWAGVFIAILGVAVLVTGFLAFRLTSMSQMRMIGGLMLVYGVLMLVIGFTMFYGLGMPMQGSLLSGSLMLVIGVLMIISGSNMVRGPRMV